jgi:ubiquinol-cytochrome c reductase cytochrome b subunit
VLWAAAANDQIADHLDLDLYAVTWFFRIAVLAVPPLAYILTQRICLGLTRRERDEAEHGHPTGRIVMNPQGGYTEIREPAHRAAAPSADPPGPATARRGYLAARQTTLRKARFPGHDHARG